MNFNGEAIRSAIIKAINISPTNITLSRENKVYDEYGSYYVDTESPIELYKGDIYIDESSSKRDKAQYSEGGVIEEVTGVKAMILQEPSYEMKKGDYFKVEDRTYIVNHYIDVYGIYYNVELRVREDGN